MDLEVADGATDREREAFRRQPAIDAGGEAHTPAGRHGGWAHPQHAQQERLSQLLTCWRGVCC